MKLGVDLDGVLADILFSIKEYSLKYYGLDLNKYKIDTYKIDECTPLTREQLNYLFDETDLFSNVPRIKYSKEYLSYLRNLDYEIFIISSRKEIHYLTTRDWLSGYSYDGLYLLGNTNKREMCMKLGIDYFVDDCKEIIIELAPICEECFLFDWSYNQGKIPINCRRVYSWEDIITNLEYIYLLRNNEGK